MFHQGDLQSGISLAIQQSKLVVCFVRDADEESKIWEDEWLQDEQLAESLGSKAIVLRLEAGSQEAGFLSAFCPIAKTPALVAIHNGQLKLYLSGGTSREDFVSRLSNALNPAEPATAPGMPQAPQALSESAGAPEPVAAQPPAPSTAEDDPYESQDGPDPARVLEASSEASIAHNVPPAAPVLPTLQASAPPVSDAQTEAQAQPASTPASVPISEKAAGKRRAVEEEKATPSAEKKDAAKKSYATQERARKASQRDELNRILQRVEADKQARKERERETKARREAELREIANAGAEGDAPSPAAPSSSVAKARSATSTSKDITLRVRLLDGSQIREPFPPTATLQSDVRPRVDWALGGGDSKPPPYTFKHVLAPLPNRNLSASEEATPLSELPDVAPSATLVLVPVRGAAHAYAAAGSAAGAVARGGGPFGAVMAILLRIWNLVCAFVGTLFAPLTRGAARGGEGGATERERHGRPVNLGGGDRRGRSAGEGSGNGAASGATAGARASGMRVRTLGDQREGQNEYYNGNSLDFEPKKGEDEGK
ncbi:uncharacterized protein K452DRAFT_355663 [Aplosporella prunicola CBS 121167]|uniref:UBX domain-containing protein 2 n=1 Tax=Aplosporella prunicola CBS 121167 TaxID=1176127 RepID=A0A6A6BTT4_9PEZI|nr:uncharacterized protein K452DRAFT_355663 [Aplosporella prunicola CBS 121167]KAF2146237.1 hypothetical protein K452DRAFT_355663 [Aplosporella prunicola CBS 121167]